MVGRSVPQETTAGDARSYINSVKETFHDEPAKYAEFHKLMKYIRDKSMDNASIYARLEELMKDHRNLLLGLNVFLPDVYKITIPPKAEQWAATDNNKRRVQVKATSTHAVSYYESVKKAFHDEPEKYDEFVKLLNDVRVKRVDKDSRILKMTELLKGHRRLLLGLSFFCPEVRSISPEAKKIVHSKAERTNLPEAEHRGSKSNNAKRKRVEPDWENFMKKLKTRFQSIDTHVVESFDEIMKMYEEGKMSENVVQEEVVDLLYYHEDLIEEFFQIL